MKKFKHVFIASIVLTSAFACGTGKPLVSESAENNQTYKVDYLFEHDGCKVYRFGDMGKYIYFSNCTGNITAISNDSTNSRIETIVRSVQK